MQRRITFITYLGQTIVNFLNFPSLCVRQPLANDTWHVNSDKEKKPFGKNKQPFSVQEFIPQKICFQHKVMGPKTATSQTKLEMFQVSLEKFLRAKHGF